jgi:hypothetical protein
MLDLQKFNREELRKQFAEASPFPFIVMDDFLTTDFLQEVEKEIRQLEEELKE